MKRHITLYLALLLAPILLLVSCYDETGMIERISLKQNYRAVRLQSFTLSSGLHDENGKHTWTQLSHEFPLDGGGWKEEKGKHVVSETNTMNLFFEKVGIYHFSYLYDGKQGRVEHFFRVHVEEENAEYSSYISEVIEYKPAPGRYVNSMLDINKNTKTDYEKVLVQCAKILKYPSQTERKGSLKALSLGGFGGQLVVGFDHLVINKPGNDFQIFVVEQVEGYDQDLMNAPGVVYVSYDQNENGLADDTWYRIKGHEYWTEEHIAPALKEYYEATSGSSCQAPVSECTITYTRNDNPKVPEEGSDAQKRGFVKQDVATWELGAAHGELGQMNTPSADSYSYWPGWITGETITFEGAYRLPDNGVERIEGEQLKGEWTPAGPGYANGETSTEKRSWDFDIDLAVDQEGNPVKLPGIQFIKIQTGVHQTVGVKGASETFLSGMLDLHL